MSATDTFDLVLIGSGPAAENGAAQAASFGKKVGGVERTSELGGACVHRQQVRVLDGPLAGGVGYISGGALTRIRPQ